MYLTGPHEEESVRYASEVQHKVTLSKGFCRGPLHGIPIGINDIFDVFNWPTACGSTLWAKSIARQDATVVASFRKKPGRSFSARR